MQAILSELSHLLVSFYPFLVFCIFFVGPGEASDAPCSQKMMQTLSDGFGM